jgi:hypothetical protein
LEYKKCPECNSDVESENSFCGKCGYNFGEIINEDVEAEGINGIKDPKNTKKPLLKRLNIRQYILNNKRMVIIVCCIIVIAIICSGIAYNNYITQKNYVNYANNFALPVMLINADVSLSMTICQEYSSIWSEAIDNGGDFNQGIQLIKNANTDNGTFKNFDNDKQLIDNSMKELSSPPAKYNNAYSDLVKVYGIYTQIYSQAENPTGSLISFNSNINDLQSSYTEAYNELNVAIPSK